MPNYPFECGHTHLNRKPHPPTFRPRILVLGKSHANKTHPPINPFRHKLGQEGDFGACALVPKSTVSPWLQAWPHPSLYSFSTAGVWTPPERCVPAPGPTAAHVRPSVPSQAVQSLPRTNARPAHANLDAPLLADRPTHCGLPLPSPQTPFDPCF